MNTSQEVIPITPQQPRPLTGDDLWKPWPEYTRLFQDHPERAASVARELFSTADLTYLPFIRSFPWDQDFRQLDEALHSSDFLIALLDFVSNDFWYGQLREIAGPERVAKESWAAIQLYYTLRCIGRLILTDKGRVERPESPELCERCLQRFPRLWKLLWEDKDIIFYHEFAGTVARDGDIFSVVRYLVECHFFMAQQFNYGDSPSIASYTAHIAFLLWHNSGDRKYQARVSSRMVVGMFEERFDPWEDNIPAFAREVVPAVIGQQDPMEVFFNALPTEGKDMLEATHLYNTLKMSLIVFHGCRSQLTMSDETRRKALYTLARLFHRYQCHGDMIHVPVTFQRISMMTLGCFYFIYKYDEGNVPKDIVTDPCNLDFISVVTSAVVHVFTVQRERSFLESSMLIPILLTRYGNKARIAINPAFRRNCAHIRRILQPRWQPILEELRLAFQSSQRTRNEDPKYTAQLRDICKVWQELGACYNLNSHSRERDSLQSLISYVAPAERLQGCFMTECPCYGRKSPWHKTRRVCRGCWAAYYCNKQCQKRDWELGHKEVCLGRH